MAKAKNTVIDLLKASVLELEQALEGKNEPKDNKKEVDFLLEITWALIKESGKSLSGIQSAMNKYAYAHKEKRDLPKSIRIRKLYTEFSTQSTIHHIQQNSSELTAAVKQNPQDAVTAFEDLMQKRSRQPAIQQQAAARRLPAAAAPLAAIVPVNTAGEPDLQEVVEHIVVGEQEGEQDDHLEVEQPGAPNAEAEQPKHVDKVLAKKAEQAAQQQKPVCCSIL